jgi:hypothetical protein
MRDEEYSQKLNRYKLLVKLGDLAISEKYGIGKVIEIELTENVLRPILVEFPKCNNPHHQHFPGYATWYDCNGEADRPENSVKFYRFMDLRYPPLEK